MPKTWFITGTSSGFGRALAGELLARGDRVVGTVRKLASMDDLKGRYGDLLRVERLDVTDTFAINAIVGAAFNRHGRIDVVVNNAGYGLARTLQTGELRQGGKRLALLRAPDRLKAVEYPGALVVGERIQHHTVTRGDTPGPDQTLEPGLSLIQRFRGAFLLHAAR